MSKNLIFDYIDKKLGKYFHGFNKNNIKTSILQGNVQLSDINLKPEEFNKLLLKNNIPFELKVGVISNLNISI